MRWVPRSQSGSSSPVDTDLQSRCLDTGSHPRCSCCSPGGLTATPLARRNNLRQTYINYCKEILVTWLVFFASFKVVHLFVNSDVLVHSLVNSLYSLFNPTSLHFYIMICLLSAIKSISERLLIRFRKHLQQLYRAAIFINWYSHFISTRNSHIV